MGISRISYDVMTAQTAFSRVTGIEASGIQKEHLEFTGS